MIRYRYIDAFSMFKTKFTGYGTYTYKGHNVTAENAEWFLFQIGRDVQLAKNVVDIGLRFDVYKKAYSYDERDIHSSIMKVFIHFLTDWEKDIKVEQKLLVKNIYEKKKLIVDTLKPKKKHKIEAEISKLENKLETINSEIVRFVKSIIETRIIIENNVVSMFTDNLDLLEKIKQLVTKSKFTFREVDLIEAKSWWEQITKEN